MTYYEIISCGISAFAAIVATIAVVFTYKNLKEIKEQFFEQNRGNLIFYIDQFKPGALHSLVLKNFGNSPAKIVSLSIDPDIIWSKAKLDFMKDVGPVRFENIFLTPNQSIVSDFDFDGYPDKIFRVSVKYITCGRTVNESYTLDLRFSSDLVRSGPVPKEEIKALNLISESIQWLARRFL